MPSQTTHSHTEVIIRDRNTVKRGAKRALYDLNQVRDIIDAALMCSVAQSVDGQPFVTPTCHWRDGDYLYWHAHRKARNVSTDQPVCINISLLDGLVLARSAFNHSVNYRSVTLFGVPESIEDFEQKQHHLRLFVDKVAPNRWSQLRPITDAEINATGIVRIPIHEASCKVRAQPPLDDDKDIDWPVWAGVIPLVRAWGKPETDPEQSMPYSAPEGPSAF